MTLLNTLFKQQSNNLCNNRLFNLDKIRAMKMHETMKRLYEAAETLKDVTGQSNVARLLNTSPQTINNWEERGMSRRGMLEAEKIIGCKAIWLETGDEGSSGTEPVSAEEFSPEELEIIAAYRRMSPEGRGHARMSVLAFADRFAIDRRIRAKG